MIEADTTPVEKTDFSAAAKDFDDKTSTMILMPKYIEVAMKHFKKPADEIKAEALKDLPGFLAAYEKWAKAQAQKEAVKKAAEKPEIKESEEMAPAECPDRAGSVMTKAFCDACKGREGCPAWA